MLRRLLPAVLILAVAACGRSPTTPPLASWDDVGGIYSICSLVFQPDGVFLPSADIRAATMDTTPGVEPAPRLRLSRQGPSYEIEYSVRDDFVTERASGSYSLQGQQVRLDLDGNQPARNLRERLVLPTNLTLDFRQESPERRTLAISSQVHQSHGVTRADYERLLGESDPNLPDVIRGTLRGEFSTAGCD